LEARIEGRGGSGREQRPRTATAERDPYASSHAPRPAKAPPELRPDPLAEIRQIKSPLAQSGRTRILQLDFHAFKAVDEDLA
ncbi:hypothetical protein AB9F45_38355, partial [Rhizobium leguminosarum]|uniref:hypothetical protein n=1 Tax=Rhizobium leguminosarum TaxID=384 RepID=UPI003F981C65